MDVDRLNSLYSQAFGGVVPQIIKSKSSGGMDIRGQKSVSEESPQELLAEHLVTEARHESKNVILYDYLYTQLEEGVAASILSPKGLTRDNYRSLLEDAFLVKVKGTADIEDYERLIYSSEEFLTVMADIAWVSGSGAANVLRGVFETKLVELQQQARDTKGAERSSINSQITNLQHELKEYQDPEKLKKKLLSESGLGLEPGYMESVARLYRYFSPNNFEVTILPSEGSEGVVFRGILDKQLLRMQPEYLRVLYEGSVSKNWTMVGEITRFPTNNSTDENIGSSAEASSEQPLVDASPTLKDITRKLFKHLAEMEGKFFESNDRVEIRLRPLAIYQEVGIQVTTQ